MLKVMAQALIILAAALGWTWAAQAAEEPAKPREPAPTTGSNETRTGGKMRLLILSGANNHAWKATTPVLKKMYEDSGRFTVDVSENVPA